MSGGRAKRRKQKKWLATQQNRFRAFQGCPNCGEKEAHFVPPSFGDEGFYICASADRNEARRWWKMLMFRHVYGGRIEGAEVPPNSFPDFYNNQWQAMKAAREAEPYE